MTNSNKQLVVITGASSGIGKAIALRLSKAGHPLLLLARRIDKLKELNLPNTLCEKVDVTNISAIAGAIKKAEDQYGKTDLLINNAGVMHLGSIDKQDHSQWQNMLNVNVLGVLNGIKAVLSAMIARNGGTIVNISSIAGRKNFPGHTAYCATKFAVHALSENIRMEVANSNVRVVVIAPGLVETELLSHTTDQELVDSYNQWKANTVEKGLAPDDIARSVEFIYNQPQDVCIRELIITPTKQDA